MTKHDDQDIPEIFRSTKSTVTFVGGPSNGDTIRLDKDTLLVEVLDPTDNTIRHSYIRSTLSALAYQGISRKKETND